MEPGLSVNDGFCGLRMGHCWDCAYVFPWWMDVWIADILLRTTIPRHASCRPRTTMYSLMHFSSRSATTKTFLVIFCTRLVGTGKTGFETALGQKKPPPRYLMLTPDDLVKYQITEIDFAPAKFDAEEDSIVTSTGNMAVVWDFGTVKRGKPIYSIRFANNAIKDVQIATNSESVVVVRMIELFRIFII